MHLKVEFQDLTLVNITKPNKLICLRAEDPTRGFNSDRLFTGAMITIFIHYIFSIHVFVYRQG